VTVFDRFRTYGYIHHRALNDRRTLAIAQRAVAEFPGVTHVFEGDVCWNFAAGRSDLYFRHPLLFFDSLSGAAIDARGPIRVEDLAALVPEGVFLAIELKIGRGPWQLAIARLLDLLDRAFAARYWIDGFSLPLMRHVKALRPDLTVTLHSEHVSGARALVLAPDSPIPRRAPIAALPLDGVSVRWHGSTGMMAQSAAQIREAGKALLVSRIHTLEQYRKSRLWQARAGYIHGDFAALMRFETATFGHAAIAVENRAVAE
jgi:hypothetical protein